MPLDLQVPQVIQVLQDCPDLQVSLVHLEQQVHQVQQVRQVQLEYPVLQELLDYLEQVAAQVQAVALELLVQAVVLEHRVLVEALEVQAQLVSLDDQGTQVRQELLVQRGTLDLSELGAFREPLEHLVPQETLVVLEPLVSLDLVALQGLMVQRVPQVQQETQGCLVPLDLQGSLERLETLVLKVQLDRVEPQVEPVPVVVQVQLERLVTQDRLVPRDSLDQVDVQETVDIVDNQVKWE